MLLLLTSLLVGACRYDDNVAAIGKLYENAKQKHAAGIDVLKREFGYHPQFKRATDQFSGVPFRPK